MAIDWKARATPNHRDFCLEEYPFFLMNMAVSKYNLALAQSLTEVKADPARWRVLMILEDQEPSSISEICELAVMNLSTITRVIQRLEKAGLVSSGPRRKDNRVTEVRMTAKGRQELQVVKKVASNLFSHATEGLSSVDVKVLNRILRNLAQNLSRSPHAMAR